MYRIVCLLVGITIGYFSRYLNINEDVFVISETFGKFNNASTTDEAFDLLLGNETTPEIMEGVGTSTERSTYRRRQKIFCWILTAEQFHESRVVNVKETWIKRCDRYMFMSSLDNAYLPSIDLNVTEDRHHLWLKTKRAFEHAYENYLEEFDWFLKADDDTYVVMENLRHFLSDHQPSDPIHFGMKFHMGVKQGYMSGGAGYVLSREALRRFVEDGLTDNSTCSDKDTGIEDVEIGYCLQATGVAAGDSRDREGRHRFLGVSLEEILTADKHNWLHSYTYYPIKEGPDCCADDVISFHYMKNGWMRVMEYFLYHMKTYGVQTLSQS